MVNTATVELTTMRRSLTNSSGLLQRSLRSYSARRQVRFEIWSGKEGSKPSITVIGCGFFRSDVERLMKPQGLSLGQLQSFRSLERRQS